MPSWRSWLKHLLRTERSWAADKAGNSIAARIAMMATTTKSSISVNPLDRLSERFAIEEVMSFISALFLERLEEAKVCPLSLGCKCNQASLA